MSNDRIHASSSPVGTQRARRASAVATGAATAPVPDPEVRMSNFRRRFSAAYKRRIVETAAQCREPGEVGALLRKEGLYSSHLSKWREQYERGVLSGLSEKKRGRAPSTKSAEQRRIAELEAQVATLRGKLGQAELIIEAQKKIAQILDSAQNSTKDKGEV